MPQVGYLQRLYQGGWSTEHKISLHMSTIFNKKWAQLTHKIHSNISKILNSYMFQTLLVHCQTVH